MPVNRLESMPLLLCATTDAPVFSDDRVIRSPMTAVVDILGDWASEAAPTRVQPLLHRRAAGNPVAATLVRIGMPQDQAGDEAIKRLAALRPQGFVLSGVRGVADIQKLDVMLRVAEAAQGLEDGAIAILAEAGEMPEFFLAPHSLRGISQRLGGVLFDGTALARVTSSWGIGAGSGRPPGAPTLFARAAAVLKTRQAGIACYDMLADEPIATEKLNALREDSLADGFSGIVVRNAAQLAALAAG